MPDLLIELLSEEIPARMQRKASSDLEQLFTEGISELGLTYESSASFSIGPCLRRAFAMPF